MNSQKSIDVILYPSKRDSSVSQKKEIEGDFQPFDDNIARDSLNMFDSKPLPHNNHFSHRDNSLMIDVENYSLTKIKVKSLDQPV
jgi:hypothetical protein